MSRHLVSEGSWDESRGPFLFHPTIPAAYACLGYCWGDDGDQVVTTETDNIQSHYQTIELAQLPLAIRDTISVCRSLEIQNLWVNSLCVIQDD